MMSTVLRLFAFLMLLPVAAAAQNFPALYDVYGVASDDSLNVRETPAPGAPILGTLAHDEVDVEVVARHGNWGRVRVGEVSGWASLRFLQAQSSSGYPLSRILQCSGTEPFWGLEIIQGSYAQFLSPDDVGPRLNVAGLVSAAGRPDRWRMITTATNTAPGHKLTAVLRRQSCGDGMSDIEYGLDVDVIVVTPGATTHYAGCCSLTSN